MGTPESKLDVRCVRVERSAEAPVVVVEDSNQPPCEAAGGTSADSGGMHREESDVLSLASRLMCKVPCRIPSKQVVHIRESRRPQSPGPRPADRAQSSTAAVLPYVVVHGWANRTDCGNTRLADLASSLVPRGISSEYGDETQASCGRRDELRRTALRDERYRIQETREVTEGSSQDVVESERSDRRSASNESRPRSNPMEPTPREGASSSWDATTGIRSTEACPARPRKEDLWRAAIVREKSHRIDEKCLAADGRIQVLEQRKRSSDNDTPQNPAVELELNLLQEYRRRLLQNTDDHARASSSLGSRGGVSSVRADNREYHEQENQRTRRFTQFFGQERRRIEQQPPTRQEVRSLREKEKQKAERWNAVVREAQQAKRAEWRRTPPSRARVGPQVEEPVPARTRFFNCY